MTPGVVGNIHWFTATADPSVSIFKPFFFGKVESSNLFLLLTLRENKLVRLYVQPCLLFVSKNRSIILSRGEHLKARAFFFL